MPQAIINERGDTPPRYYLSARAATGTLRRAAKRGKILAEAGCTQYQIMAIHGHTESCTSEIYTRGAARPELTRQGMETL